MKVETGTNSIMVEYSFDGCLHELGTLGCPGHNFEHVVGYFCHLCYEQWFFPHWDECAKTDAKKKYCQQETGSQ